MADEENAEEAPAEELAEEAPADKPDEGGPAEELADEPPADNIVEELADEAAAAVDAPTEDSAKEKVEGDEGEAGGDESGRDGGLQGAASGGKTTKQKKTASKKAESGEYIWRATPLKNRSYSTCPHMIYKTAITKREGLSRAAYTDILSKPKVHPWQDEKETEADGCTPKKHRYKKRRCTPRTEELSHPKKIYVKSLLLDIGCSLDPKVAENLLKWLDEELIRDEKKEDRSRYQRMARAKMRYERREFIRCLINSLLDSIAISMESPLGIRETANINTLCVAIVKRINEVYMENPLENHTVNQLSKLLTTIVTRIAIWIDGIMDDVEFDGRDRRSSAEQVVGSLLYELTKIPASVSEHVSIAELVDMAAGDDDDMNQVDEPLVEVVDDDKMKKKKKKEKKEKKKKKKKSKGGGEDDDSDDDSDEASDISFSSEESDSESEDEEDTSILYIVNESGCDYLIKEFIPTKKSMKALYKEPVSPVSLGGILKQVTQFMPDAEPQDRSARQSRLMKALKYKFAKVLKAEHFVGDPDMKKIMAGASDKLAFFMEDVMLDAGIKPSILEITSATQMVPGEVVHGEVMPEDIGIPRQTISDIKNMINQLF